mmetsp:Transcript_45275/g.125618  ORF Transcript_45275/g.125618 Transcript_45275/m.125618 type:complete len:343 (-) Transcript_45275:1693-2721(-)
MVQPQQRAMVALPAILVFVLPIGTPHDARTHRVGKMRCADADPNLDPIRRRHAIITSRLRRRLQGRDSCIAASADAQPQVAIGVDDLFGGLELGGGLQRVAGALRTAFWSCKQLYPDAGCDTILHVRRGGVSPQGALHALRCVVAAHSPRNRVEVARTNRTMQHRASLPCPSVVAPTPRQREEVSRSLHVNWRDGSTEHPDSLHRALGEIPLQTWRKWQWHDWTVGVGNRLNTELLRDFLPDLLSSALHCRELGAQPFELLGGLPRGSPLCVRCLRCWSHKRKQLGVPPPCFEVVTAHLDRPRAFGRGCILGSGAVTCDNFHDLALSAACGHHVLVPTAYAW